MLIVALTLAFAFAVSAGILWRQRGPKSRQLALMGVIAAVTCITLSACGSSSDAAPKVVTKTQVVKVGVARKASAVAVSKKLDDAFEKVTSESESLDDAISNSESAVSSSKAAVSRAAAESSRAASAAASSQAAAQAAAASQAAESRQAAARAAAQTSHAAPVNNGDMHTGNTGRIVGNANSKIYHVPGQASYRMNSSNAVYFNSEAEAIAAGYRRSLR